MKDRGSAAIDICGGFGFKMYCATASAAAESVRRKCECKFNGGFKAGGYMQYSGGRVIVYHS